MLVLVFGHKGYLGSAIIKLMTELSIKYVCASARLDNEIAVIRDLDFHQPTHVFCCAGRTHGGKYHTIDYLEQSGKLVENIRDNLFSQIMLAMICKDRDVHCTIVGTGCIYESEYDLDGKACDKFTEHDPPNFFGSSYSTVKGFTDRLLQSSALSNTCLNVRIRMPFSSEPNSRNTLTKLLSYEDICSLENSITTIDLFKHVLHMMDRKTTGSINLCHPGGISHEQILGLYQKYVDPNHEYNLVDRKQLFNMLPAERSNTVLDTTRLESLFEVPSALEAMKSLIKEYGQNVNADK